MAWDRENHMPCRAWQPGRERFDDPGTPYSTTRRRDLGPESRVFNCQATGRPWLGRNLVQVCARCLFLAPCAAIGKKAAEAVPSTRFLCNALRIVFSKGCST